MERSMIDIAHLCHDAGRVNVVIPALAG